MRDLARAHAPDAIKKLARLAVKAKSEPARISAIRELLDRGYGKPTQFLEAGTEIVADNKSAAELQAELFAEFAVRFPELEIVPENSARKDAHLNCE